MDHIRRVVIGLGSNVGDRVATIELAVERLRQDDALHVLTLSPLYETPPDGGPPQHDYVNGAVLVLTNLAARDILGRLHVIEAALGRVRGEPNAPRTIDLDILWIEGESIHEPDLVVPHPRLAQRAFALRPLLDVASDAADPERDIVFADLPLAHLELRVKLVSGSPGKPRE